MFRYIDLLKGIELNPVGMDFTQALTTTEWLGEMQHALNSIVDMMNNLNVGQTENLNQLEKEILEKFEQFKLSIYNLTIPDNSITIKKLSKQCIEEITKMIESSLKNPFTFMDFGVNDDGKVYVIIPENWEDLNFLEDSEGHFCIQILENYK